MPTSQLIVGDISLDALTGDGSGLTALGSLDLHSDVDVTSTAPAIGDTIVFDGTSFVTYTSTAICKIYDSAGGQNFNGAGGVSVSWGANDIVDSDFTNLAGSGIVTINRRGVYRLTYNLSYDTNANARRTCRGSIRLNGVEQPATASYSYARNTVDDEGSTNATTILTLDVGDTIEVFVQGVGTTGASLSIANESWLLIEFIRNS